uniref:Uncharacterized protein n=1 Tax=Trichogramma kaykai TaxID=54128 RepID=A0ABD2WZW8_9HYME
MDAAPAHSAYGHGTAAADAIDVSALHVARLTRHVPAPALQRHWHTAASSARVSPRDDESVSRRNNCPGIIVLGLEKNVNNGASLSRDSSPAALYLT